MLKDSKAFSGFSVDDLAKAKKFYGEVLGLEVTDNKNMGLEVKLGSGASVFIYPKDNHKPADFTILNFPVDDIDAVVENLTGKGVIFERYPDMDYINQDEKGIARMQDPAKGPSIAWFKDPAGNILSVLQ
jgi:catechol 2,3-dioxygenase-like lactoylglutathione lyase family enzyme